MATLLEMLLPEGGGKYPGSGLHHLYVLGGTALPVALIGHRGARFIGAVAAGILFQNSLHWMWQILAGRSGVEAQAGAGLIAWGKQFLARWMPFELRKCRL
jgi:hypothetical protein